MFKLENEDVWAVGWSDVHYKTYITTYGCMSDGDPAQKKRQRLDGRNYKIDIARPKVIASNVSKPHGLGGPAQSFSPRHIGPAQHLENQTLANAGAD